MIIVKEGVVFKRLTPEMLHVMDVVESVFEGFKIDPVITSAADGKHRVGSLHGYDQALDWRSKNLPSDSAKQEVLRELREILGSDYDVILEALGRPNEHYHIEYDPS